MNFILREKKNETPDIVTLVLEPESKQPLVFAPGQYMTVYFLDERMPSHGKPYTISSAPHEPHIAITVKRTGTFSSLLHGSRPGTVLYLEGPEGDFSPGETEKNIVLIASDIGITPFISILRDAQKKKDAERSYALFYEAETPSGMAFEKELSRMAGSWKNFRFHPRHARKPGKSSGPLAAHEVCAGTRDAEDPAFYVSGPNEFVSAMWKDLMDEGVSDRRIFLESFY